jgi:hypothetical protein
MEAKRDVIKKASVALGGGANRPISCGPRPKEFLSEAHRNSPTIKKV